MDHIIWDVFTAMRARTCYRVFVTTLFRTLYSTCRHILISSNPRLNYQKSSLQPSKSSCGPRLGLPTGPLTTPPPSQVPTPRAFPMGVSLKQEKPPENNLRGFHLPDVLKNLGRYGILLRMPGISASVNALMVVVRRLPMPACASAMLAVVSSSGNS